MNVEGAAVERRLERSLLPRLHAAFSLGTVGGALLGAAAASAGVALSVQVLAVGLAAPLAAIVAARSFLPGHADVLPDEQGSRALGAWREPRTLLVGLLVLAFAFTEGTANDWIAVALVDGYDTSEAAGALAFGVFVTAMTAGRLFGGQAVDRLGRVVVLRATAALALAGLLLVVLGDAPAVALAGAALWGLGASLGFPVGISAAADDPARAAARVSVVTTIGYTAFLAGPPLIGLLAETSGILRALVVTVGALVLGLVLAGVARPLSADRARAW
jgi:predicted MFS family arabinose efflux permease